MGKFVDKSSVASTFLSAIIMEAQERKKHRTHHATFLSSGDSLERKDGSITSNGVPIMNKAVTETDHPTDSNAR